MDQINILITAIGGGGHGDQILKALKFSKQKNYNIIGADVNPNCPQFKETSHNEVLPSAGSENYIPELLRIIEKYRINVLFHGCEPELKKFSEFRDLIESKNVFLPINPKHVIEMCMNKLKTNKFLTDSGFKSPKFKEINSLNDIEDIDWFPLVVKPSVGGGGSADVYIAQDRKELLGLTTYLDLSEEKSFFLQEYVGDRHSEFTVGVLHDMKGEYINSIALRRSLESQLNIKLSVKNKNQIKMFGEKLIISSGISMGEIGRFPLVTEQCKKIANALGAKGAINIQGRLVDDIFYVFEINPRFSGTTSLRAMAGYNEPDILIRKHLLDEKIEKDFNYSTKTIIRSLKETII